MQDQAANARREPAIAPPRAHQVLLVLDSEVARAAQAGNSVRSQNCSKLKRYKTNAVYHSMTAPSAAPAASATGEISDAASASDWRPSAIATNGANDVLS